jgi:hypothetical protein
LLEGELGRLERIDDESIAEADKIDESSPLKDIF